MRGKPKEKDGGPRREERESSPEKLASPSPVLQSYSEELLKVFDRLHLPPTVHTPRGPPRGILELTAVLPEVAAR